MLSRFSVGEVFLERANVTAAEVCVLFGESGILSPFSPLIILSLPTAKENDTFALAYGANICLVKYVSKAQYVPPLNINLLTGRVIMDPVSCERMSTPNARARGSPVSQFACIERSEVQYLTNPQLTQ